MNLTKALLGTGLLMLPASISWCGIYLALFLLLISGFMIFYCITLFQKICNKIRIYPKHYPEFVELVFKNLMYKKLIIIIIILK